MIFHNLAGHALGSGLTPDENPRTAQRYGIMLVPTIGLFRGGEVIKQVVGAKSKSALPREFDGLP